MTIIEFLTIELSSSIAKAILKVWLKDYSIASDITSDLLGLIKGKTTEVLAQNRTKRQFDAIGEKVVENLLPLFEVENSTFSEDSQKAIILKVSEILNNSKINAKLLAEGNLDPSNLLTYLQKLHPDRSRDFSDKETIFFENVLSDVCQNIVDIASALPGFTDQTLAEVLKRESNLIQKANEIIEEIKRIRESSESTNKIAQVAIFETDYRRSIIRKLDVLELFGADVSRASQRHRLSVAYVTLSAEEVLIKNNKNNNNFDDEEQENKSKTISIDEIILANSRLFIKGDAGSGKTTLLQWIAVRSASSDFNGQLSILNEYTPFFIRLRQFVDKNLPTPEEFPKLLAPIIADTMPKGWVHEKLKSGKAIILIDGLDEISQAKRNNVKEWIKELIIHFPDTRFIVSSRPTATDEDWLKPEGFHESTLQSMTKQDIFAFIDHWHSAVSDALQDSIEKEELKPLAEKLKNIIENNRSIYNLATSPLLCAMISALHRERRSQLPKDRIELYEACTSMLLERREIERNIDYSDYPNLTYRQKRAFLNYFAYWLIKNKLSLVEIERTDAHFEARLKMLEQLAETTGTNIRKLFLERSGLLREPIKGSLHFAHRTFQEYLAAQAAIDEDDIGVLVSNAHDDQWREVIILGAGLASQKKREELIINLIKRGDDEPNCQHQLHLLSVACLETSVLLSPEIKQEIQKRLKQLKLPKNMSEAKQWASAGELSIPYLIKGHKENVAIASSCVRALLLIGGEIGLKSLEFFAKDDRSTVLNELEKGVEYYDLDIYSKFIFSKNPMFANFFSNITSLTGIEHINYLEKLAIFGDLQREIKNENKLITNIDALSNLQKLHNLKISNFSYYLNLKSLKNLTNLRSLSLNNMDMLENIEDISDLKNLETLEISNCKNIRNIDILNKLENLRILRIEKCENILDLSTLSKLSNLEMLSLPGCKNISQIDFLSNSKKLKYLSIPYCVSLKDISALSSLESLEIVNLCDCNQLAKISALSNSKNLMVLDLTLCVAVEDLEIIQNFSKIIYLSLMGITNKTQNKDLTFSLPVLRSVNLIGTQGINLDAVTFSPHETTSKIFYPHDILLNDLYHRMEAINRRKKYLSSKIENDGQENDSAIIDDLSFNEQQTQTRIQQLEKNKSAFILDKIDTNWNLYFFRLTLGRGQPPFFKRNRHFELSNYLSQMMIDLDSAKENSKNQLSFFNSPIRRDSIMRRLL